MNARGNEMDRLRRQLFMERSREIQKFIEKLSGLAVGDEVFQCHICALPKVEELRRIVNDKIAGMKFSIWPTINGTMVRREQ